jgi:RNA polymerase sigma-70 factor (ECF subfamily)
LPDILGRGYSGIRCAVKFAHPIPRVRSYPEGWPSFVVSAPPASKPFPLSGFTVALTEIDRSLLERCLAEEAGAWKDFVDRFIGLFIHVINHSAHARSVRLSSDDIDDLCAEVFVALLADNYAALKRFRGESSLATYLTVISRRIVVREMARRKMAEALGHVSAHHSSIEQARAAPNWDVKRVDDRDQIQRMLEGLPEREATVVRQYHIEGRSYREISADLGVPENSIGPTLSRARERLKEGARP